MERKNLIGSAPTVRGRSSLFNRAASRRGIRLAPLLLIAVMLAAVAVLAETSNPAQTAHAHGGDDHTHRCTSPPDERCPTYGDVPAEGAEIWSATMTVAGPIPAFGKGYLLFPRVGAFGSLSPVTFMLDGDT